MLGFPRPRAGPSLFEGSAFGLPDSLRRVTDHLALPVPKNSIATAAPIRIAAIVAPLRTASRESPKSYSATYPSVIAMQTAAAIVTQSILFSMLHAHAYIASDDGQLGSDVTTIHYSP